MNIGDVYVVNNFSSENYAVIVLNIKEKFNTIDYLDIKTQKKWSWYLSIFITKYQFSQKLTDQQTIKNIIE